METVVLSQVKTGQAGQARVSSVLGASDMTFSSRWLQEGAKVPGQQQLRDGSVVAWEEGTSVCVFLSSSLDVTPRILQIQGCASLPTSCLFKGRRHSSCVSFEDFQH